MIVPQPNTNLLLNGDCLIHLKELPENSVDAIITDPPYGLSFMNKHWDYDVPSVDIWKECLRVLKHGGHLLSFAGTRTYHRMACAVEDAGFEIRDMISWIYGSGFPKSLNIGKQIDKINFRFYDKGFQNYCNECRLKKGYSHNKVNELMGVATTGGGFSSSIMGNKEFNELPTLEMYNKLKPILEMDNRYDELIKKTEAEREVIGKGQAKFLEKNNVFELDNKDYGDYDLTAPATEQAKQWGGWGTALKPACEPIVVARKPLSEKNVALNVLKWGTGGINIDECRIETNPNVDDMLRKTSREQRESETWKDGSGFKNENNELTGVRPDGRFPANVILDEEAGKMLDEMSGNQTGAFAPVKQANRPNNVYGDYEYFGDDGDSFRGDKGGASRFFYCAKSSKSERNLGLENLPIIEREDSKQNNSKMRYENGIATNERPLSTLSKNNHPTVKPLKLMEYLVKLITKENQIVLDPFLGSGTTAIACINLNRLWIGIEREPEYIKIAQARIKYYSQQEKLK